MPESYITISTEEYKALLKIESRVEILIEMLLRKDSNFMLKSDILPYLGIENEEDDKND